MQNDVRRPRDWPTTSGAHWRLPLDEAIGEEATQRYEAALAELRDEEREAIVARIELQCSYDEMAVMLGKPSPNAARVACSTSRDAARLEDERCSLTTTGCSRRRRDACRHARAGGLARRRTDTLGRGRIPRRGNCVEKLRVACRRWPHVHRAAMTAPAKAAQRSSRPRRFERRGARWSCVARSVKEAFGTRATCAWDPRLEREVALKILHPGVLPAICQPSSGKAG